MKDVNTFSEINLKVLIRKILKRKLLFAISIILCLAVAYIYIKLAIPMYEVKTLLLIDSSGNSRMLGESKYVEGKVGQIGTVKNLNNEIVTLKTFNLVNRAIKELDFGVSYYFGDWLKKEEKYNNFPFKVEINDLSNQLYGELFKVELLNANEFRLSIKVDEFEVGNPTTKMIQKIKKEFEYSETFSYGEEIKHEYFQFVINDSDSSSDLSDFIDGDLFFELHSEKSLTKSYLAKMEVNQVDLNSSILRIKSTGPVLKKELDFLTVLGEKFIESKITERDEIASSKAQFIENQLLSIADSLDKAERNLEVFRKGAKAVDLNKTATNALDQLQDLESDRGRIALNVKYYYTMLDYLRDDQEYDKIIAPSVVGIEDPVLNENLAELKRLNSERTDLNFYKGRKSNDLIMINKQIENKKHALEENLKSLVHSSELALKSTNARIGTLESTINRLPSSEKKLLSYQRKSTLYENLFNYLTQELAKTGIARAENIPDTKILDTPSMVGNGPVSPQKKVIVALAVFIGLLLPFLWIVYHDLFDESDVDSEDLDSLTTLPIVGNINRMQNGEKMLDPTAQNRLIDESFRDLSANLQFLIRDKTKKVIGVNSKISNDGKTFCATNLSCSLAKEGKKILLIDLNFRNPQIALAIGEKIVSDLSGFLKGETHHVDDIIHTYKPLTNLHYIPTYSDSKNPNNLILSERLSTIIDDARHKYDYIILDSPAFGIVSDYLLISKFVDIHLFVLRKDISKLANISSIEKLIDKGNMELAFMVFNGFETRSKKNSYPIFENENAKQNGVSAFSVKKSF